MYLYYKQAHKTHLLLIEENDSIIKNYESINYGRLFLIQNRLKHKKMINESVNEKPTKGIAVDAWCVNHLQGPGPGGYKGIDIETGEQLFLQNHLGPCTNNVAEFLAIVHGMMYCKKERKHDIVYSDSEIAIQWVKMKQSNSKVDLTCNPELIQKIWRAEKWLSEQKRLPTLKKWETKHWGETPADFGNK